MEKKNGQKLIKHVKGLFSDKCKSTGSIDFVFPPRKHESSDMCWISGNKANVDLEKVVGSTTMPKIKKKNKIGTPGMRNCATNILVLTKCFIKFISPN